MDYINDINEQVDGQGIDFLTIREDFGSVTEITDSIDKIGTHKTIEEQAEFIYDSPFSSHDKILTLKSFKKT